ncbi:MAG: hypothetical protein OEZ19_06340 [Paracoccaceae bacterium]|nr:hypothetical protein [Paracoccaceae bacterium]
MDETAAALRRYLPAIYLLLAGMALLPFVLVGRPALIDFPNHLARLHVLAHIGDDALLAANYQVVWSAMPNLAMEIVSWPFLGLLLPETLGLLFTALSMAGLVAGTLALHRVLYGNVGLWPAAAWLFLYNHLLIMGFLNYLFATGCALLLFAGWIASEGKPAWIRLVLFPAALIGLFFAHLFALGVYGVCVAGYELSRAWPDLRADWKTAVRSRIAMAWQFLPVAALVLATMPPGGGRSFYYGPLLQKVKALWSPMLAYLKPIDLGIFIFVAAVLIGGLATRRLVLTRHLRLPIILLTLLALAMPFQMEGAWGHIWYTDLRLPTIIALLLVAGLRPRNVGPKLLVTIAAAGFVLFAGRIYDTTSEWRRVDSHFDEFRAALHVIEPGATILPVQKQDVPLPEGETRFDHAYWHMPVLAVIDRSAFVPTLFTDPTKQPVRAARSREIMDSYFGAPIELALLVDAATGGNAVAGGIGMQPYWEDWPSRYDYVLITHFGAKGNPLPEILTPVQEGSFFDIYQVAGEER